jgi:hypothetical protein
MQINGVSSVILLTPGRTTTPPQSNTAIPSPTAAVSQAEPAASFTSSVTDASLSAVASKPPPAVSSSSIQIQSAASSSRAAMLSTSYSTTVAGKSYAGTVQKVGGTYVASVPLPPGASASGSSVQSAENNLQVILDTLA